jgi:hypothetical protein
VYIIKWVYLASWKQMCNQIISTLHTASTIMPKLVIKTGFWKFCGNSSCNKVTTLP